MITSSPPNRSPVAPSSRESRKRAAAPVTSDGFEPFDLCHRQTVLALGKLAALVTRLAGTGPDAQARELAADVLQHFSTTMRRHHEDEEREVFPALLATADAGAAQAIGRLKQDHAWLEQDWTELSPHIAAVADAQSWYDLDFLREGTAIFAALSREHIALEESVIYPQVRSLPSDPRPVAG